MRVQRLGHACLLVETDDNRLLIDPGTFSDDWHSVEDLDAVLITHQHADHVDAPGVGRLIERNHRTRVLAEAAVVDMLASEGVEAAAAAPGESFDTGSLQVSVEGGEHAVIHSDLAGIGNVGFVISDGDGARLYHPGDSYGYPVEGVDVLALPITAPWARMEMTADFLAAVDPGRAFPIHDAIASDEGRDLYLRLCSQFGGLEIERVGPTDPLDL